ncbi:MAG: DUF5672 family protein [Parachlamydiales bacterium]
MTVSLSCVATREYAELSCQAIETTLQNVKIAKIYWFSDIDFPGKTGLEVVKVKIKPFDQKKNFNDQLSYITLKLMPEVVQTDYNLIVQYDGFAVNKAAWTDRFFDYDYIGSAVNYSWFSDGKKRVGNGGFSWRSKKLYRAFQKIGIKYRLNELPKAKKSRFRVDFADKFTGQSVPEDFIICCIYRKLLEKKYGIRFAPLGLADRFSIGVNVASPWVGKSLGFHGPFAVNFCNSVFYSLLKK